VRFIDGSLVNGTVSFISISADKATRTYPVQVRMANADAAIADGVTCEMVVTTAPVEAASVPRSALVFSDAGELGVRVVDGDDKAQFVPIKIIDDRLDSIWVSGIDQPTRVIVVGQDFVKDGDQVESVTEVAGPPTEPPA
jgi:membrane fusion protein, multidrug efflux system